MKHHNTSWIHPGLKAKKSLKYGKQSKGVFARQDIKKGEVLAVFGGNIYDLTKKIDLLEVETNGDLTLQISDRFVIGLTDLQKFDDSEFFNHSCDPNAGIKGQILLISMRTITTGEEVTFDYAMVLQNMPGVEPYVMDCLCGKRNCRRIVTENDWRIPTLQNKYRGFFNIFIQEKIDRVKQ